MGTIKKIQKEIGSAVGSLTDEASVSKENGHSKGRIKLQVVTREEYDLYNIPAYTPIFP